MKTNRSANSATHKELARNTQNCEFGSDVDKHYVKPILVFYGDVRDVTLGGSGSSLESGPFGPDGCKLSGQKNRNCLP